MKKIFYSLTVFTLLTPKAFSLTLLESAQEIFATYYQSCESLDAPILDDQDYSNFEVVVQRKHIGSAYKRYLYRSKQEKYHENNPVFNYLKHTDPNSCLNSFLQPPVYAYGGTASFENNMLDFLDDLTKEKECNYSPGNGTICRKTKEELKTFSPLSGIDCSAYISAAMAMSGYKFKTSQSKMYQRYTTTTIHNAIYSGSKACLKTPTLDVENPLKKGDILNVKASHIVLVDTLGSDPLGINKTMTIRDCEDITVDDFTFSIIQSASAHSIGLQRSFASAYFKRSGNYFRTNMELIAQRVCEAKYRGSSHWKVRNSSRSKFSLTRFDQSKKNCHGQKIESKQKECFNGCF